MSRRAIILRHVNKDAEGLEIGPSFHPIAPKQEGFRVHVMDHDSRENLVEKYRKLNLPVERIEEVDFIWRGEPYAELTGKKKHYSWIIASHVIEHTPDLIGFLNDCDSVLRDDGVISLAVPDKRRCFDYFRPITGLAKVLDHHFEKYTRHTPGTVVEHHLNYCTKNNMNAWDIHHLHGECQLGNSLEHVVATMEQALQTDEYMDSHAWCFVPHSFRLLIHDLHSLGLIPFREVDFTPTGECEFLVTLGRQGKGPGLNRQEMLKQIQKELLESMHVREEQPSLTAA